MRDRSESGFTLVELLVVLAILGFCASLLLWRTPSPGNSTLAADIAASDIAQSLRAARVRAIAQDRNVLVPFSALARAGVAVAAPPDGIAFSPDGSSSGGEIVVRAARRVLTVRVDWLTGRVAVK